MNYRCGHCGYEGPCYGNGFSAPWCARCQRNDKLEIIMKLRSLHLGLINAQLTVTEYLKPIIDAIQGCEQSPFTVIDLTTENGDDYEVRVEFKGGDLWQTYKVPGVVLKASNPITAALEYKRQMEEEDKRRTEDWEREQYARLDAKYGQKKCP